MFFRSNKENEETRSEKSGKRHVTAPKDFSFEGRATRLGELGRLFTLGSFFEKLQK
jgi:hypothetical protein